ncbi:MAG: hypothetical protein AAGE52_34660 [Myxococcota bacterium]
MTPREFVGLVDAAYQRLRGRKVLLLRRPELVEAAAEYDEDWDLLRSEQWDLFRNVAAEFVDFAPANPLFEMFLYVLLAPYATEEEFLSRDEFIDAMEGAEFPAGFSELLERADECYTLEYEYPPTHVALWSSDGGWVLAYPDRLLEFATPKALCAFFEASR